jgi:hypothetical protein
VYEGHRVPNELIDPARFAQKLVCKVQHKAAANGFGDQLGPPSGLA